MPAGTPDRPFPGSATRSRYSSPVVAPIVVVAGPTGAGKSAVSQLVAGGFSPSVLVQADEVMGWVVNGVGRSVAARGGESA